jgi:hypothetical protein
MRLRRWWCALRGYHVGASLLDTPRPDDVWSVAWCSTCHASLELE